MIGAGIFEEADGGTILLDEIGELPQPLQVKLLRVLQEKEIRRVGEDRCVSIDVRIIAATAKDLSQEAQKGAFREDLFYRLNVLPVHIPPLREREEDIPLLVDYFLQKYNQQGGRIRPGHNTARVKAADKLPLAGQCPGTGKHYRAYHGYDR